MERETTMTGFIAAVRGLVNAKSMSLQGKLDTSQECLTASHDALKAAGAESDTFTSALVERLTRIEEDSDQNNRSD